MKSLVIKLPKKLSREAAARLGSERVAPGQAVPLHPEAVAFAGHYGFDIDVLAAYRPTGKPRVAYCTSWERLVVRWRSCSSQGVVP